MIKGYTKHRKNLSSIIIVPHSTGKPHILHVSSLKLKLFAFLALLVAVIISLNIMIVRTIEKNKELENEYNELTDSFINQKRAN